MEKALKIYNDFCDMDCGDYSETMEADVVFIHALLCEIGEADTIKFLQVYFE